MKKITVILIALFYIGTISAQNIKGKWQKNSNVVGSGLGETYCFYENGKFEFILSQYLYLNTIISFEGTYEIKDNEICFTISSRKERVGAHIEQGSPAWQDNWVLEGGEIKEIKQEPVKYCFDFSFSMKENKSIITIGNSSYFKIRKEDE